MRLLPVGFALVAGAQLWYAGSGLAQGFAVSGLLDAGSAGLLVAATVGAARVARREGAGLFAGALAGLGAWKVLDFAWGATQPFFGGPIVAGFALVVAGAVTMAFGASSFRRAGGGAGALRTGALLGAAGSLVYVASGLASAAGSTWWWGSAVALAGWLLVAFGVASLPKKAHPAPDARRIPVAPRGS